MISTDIVNTVGIKICTEQYNNDEMDMDDKLNKTHTSPKGLFNIMGERRVK